MKRLSSVIKILINVFLAVLLLSTCKNPFTAGLGDKVDLEVPKLEIISHSNGDAVGGTFTLSGTVDDDGEIDSVSISLNTADNIIGSAVIEGTGWSFSYDTTALPDGDQEFTITAKDDSGKSVSTKIFLTVDNNPPSVLVTVPANYGVDEEFNKNITIKGEAADTTRVKNVKVSLYNAADNSVIFEDQAAIGTSSWYYTFNAETTAGGLNGVYYFFVSAEDFSGNKNTYFYHFDDILNAASDPATLPNIEEINAADFQNTPLASGILTVSLSSLRKTTALTEQMAITINPDSDKPEFIFINPSIVVFPADPLLENILGTPQRLSGFVEDDDGVDFSTLQIRISDYDTSTVVTGYDWTTIDPANISGTQWTYETSLPDGNYYVDLKVNDIYGTSGTTDGVSIVAFKVSSYAPVVTIATPTQGSYVGNNSVFTVTANVSGLTASGTVELDSNGDDDWSDAIVMTDAGGGVYTLTMTGGVNFTAVNGLITFKIRAGVTDNYGTTSLQLTGDIDPPVVSVVVPASGGIVNGTINIAGTSSDNNLVSNVYLWIEEDADPATDPPADFTTWNIPDSSDVYNWIYNIDTTTLNNGAHTIHVKAVDAAANASVDFSSPFTVDQESDRPIISLSNMVIGGTGLENGLGRDASIIGLVQDDDSVDVSTLEVRVDINDDGLFTGVDLNGDLDTLDANESEQWIPVSDPPGSDGTIVSWTHSLLNVTQGTHSMQIRVHDIKSSGVPDTGTNPNYAEIPETQFMIDYGPPDLIITFPANGAIFNTDFSITGTASDANGVLDVQISINGGAFTTIMDPADSGNLLVNWNYSFTVDPGGADDGDYAYQVQAIDMSGGKTTLDRQLVVDATTPEIVIEIPAAGASVNGSSVTVAGTATDNRDVLTVYQYIEIEGTPPPADTALWDIVTGTYSWSSVFDSLSKNNTSTAVNYVIYIKAEDKAGNISSAYTRTISIDQFSDRPKIDFNDIDKTEVSAANNVLVGATSLTGIIEEDDLFDPALFSGSAVEINLDDAGWVPVSTPPAAAGKLVIWKHDISSLIEGAHTVRVRARDNQSDGTVGTLSTDYNVAPFDTNYNWAIEDGPTASGIPFILNIGPPTIVINEPANYSYHNTDVVISGDATDANGVQSVFVSFDNGLTWTDLGITPGSPAPWSYTLSVDPAGADDGTYSYLIRAVDTYGSSGVENGQFTVDATSPGLLINLPANGVIVNDSLTISGTASDNVLVSKVYLAQGTTAPAPPALGDPEADLAYTVLGSTYSWNYTLDTIAVNNTDVDQAYYVSLVSVDGAGNVSANQDLNFIINQGSDRPVITFSSILEAGTFIENLLPSSKQITGTITDDDSVKASSVEYQLYAEDGTTLITDWTVVSGPPSTDTTLASWTHIFDAGVTDGKYQAKIRAADVIDTGLFTLGGFGWAESALVKFAVDTANPETTITSPASNGGYTNQDFTVSGTATDAGGIKRVLVQFNADPAITVYENLLEPFNTSQAWSTNFTVDTITHTDDGVLNYTITVTDAYDKVKTIDRYINVDTQVPVTNSLVLVNNDPGTPGTVNGSVLIQGSPIDYQTLISAIYIKTDTVQPAEPGLDPVSEGWTLLGSTTNIYYRFNSELLTDLTPYTTYVVVEDLAGNRTAVTDYSLSFTPDQSGNSPVVTIDTPDGTLLNSGNSISGSISDDDGVDVSTIEISFDGGAWIPVTSASASDSTNVVFSHSLAVTSEQINPYSIQIRASDIGEDFADDAQDVAPVSSSSTSINIYVDNSDPTAAITQISNGSLTSPTLQGLYINDQFTIEGTSLDGVQIADVRAKLAIDADFTSFPVTDTNGDSNAATPFDTWQWDRSGLAIGADSVVMSLEVEDVHGKVTPYSYTLLVDSAAPSVSYITASGTYHGDFEIRGTSSDNVLVSKVYLAQGTTLPLDPVSGDPESDLAYTALGSTYSWNYILDTRAVNNTDVDQNYYVSVVAVDGAGNVSAKQDLSFIINQGSDRPNITFSNVTVGAAANLNLLESNAKILGAADDDDGLSTIEFATSEDDITYSAYGVITSDGTTPVAVSGLSISWQNYVADLGEGVHYIKFRVRDIEYVDASTPFNEVESPAIAFTIDTGAPSVSITDFDIDDAYGAGTFNKAAAPGVLINNSFLVSGTASDGNTLTSVKISTDGVTYINVDTLSEPSWSHTITITRDGSQDGTLTLYITATDEFAKSTTISLPVTIDTIEPAITPTQPAGIDLADPPNVNGLVTVRGSITEVSAITSFSAIGGDSDDVTLTNTGTELNWVLDVNTDLYANGTYSTETDPGVSNVWRFPIDVGASDAAGNQSTEVYQLDIDPDSDKPLLYLATPADASSVGGAFIVQGTATDDDDVQKVTIQVDLDDDGFYTSSYDLDLSTTVGDSNFEDEAVPVDIAVSNGSWSILMNQVNEFNKANLIAAGYAGADGWIRLKVIPYDVNSLAGDPTEVRIFVDSTAPIIEGQGLPAPTPASGSIVNGSTLIQARFKDDDSLDTAKMQISYDGGVSYQSITSAGGTITPNGLVSGYYEYDIDLSVDTTDAGGIVPGGNGILQAVLKVTDETYKQSSVSIQLNVDNTLPTGVWNYNSSLTAPSGIYTFYGNASLGGDYMLIGSAEDLGTISGVYQVDVFFVKAGNFYNPTTGVTLTTTGNTAVVADMSGTDQTIPFPPGTDYDNYVISIDKRSERGIYDTDPVDGDQDGFEESLKSMGTYDEWFVYFDTTVFPDGPIDIYYVVYDTAGNISYELVSSQMSNNPPSIDSYDINSTNYDTADIKVKLGGTVNVTMNVSDAEAIDTASYKMTIANKYAIDAGGAVGAEDTGFTPVQYLVASFTSVTSSSADLAIDTTSLVSSNWYRIVGEIKDSDGNTVTREWWLWVFNSDIAAPTLTLNAFTQDNEPGTGHIEESGNSPDLDGQADLSGTIIVNGTAYDDSAVSSVTVEISQDGGTTWSDIGDATLVDVDDGDVTNGTDYTWSLSWDTSTITGNADADVQVRVRAFDGTNTTAEVDRPLSTVDIVPYITDITTGFEIGLKSFVKRSALGKYTVAQGNTITIKGYNLPGTASSSVDIGGTALTATSAVGTTQLDIDLTGVTTSGELTVTTNGVSSRNNTNTNTLPQNEEPSQYYPDRKDDRYIALWQLTNTGLSGDEAVMRPVRDATGNQTDMEWMYVTTSDTLYLGIDKMTQSFTLSGGDFGYNDNGTRLWSFLHNAKWWITETYSTDEQYFGSIQWSMENGYTYTTERDEAYNWNIAAQTGRLGLGNMVYLAGTLGQIDRYSNVQMKLFGNDTSTANQVAYYDANLLQKGITFVSFNTGTAVPNTDYDLGGGWYSTVERVNPYDKAYAPTGNESQKATGICNPEYAGTSTIARFNIIPGDDASSDFILALDSAGAAYIAWYDPDTSTGGGNGFDGAGLKFTYNTDPVGNPTGWTDPVTVASNGSNTAYSYIAMAIAPDGSVHFAYQDNNNGFLNYTYAASRADVGVSMNTVLVDALFSSGQYNSIVIKDFDTTAGTDYRPVITTFSSAYTGTNQALRLVYPNGIPASIGDGAEAVSGNFTGNWESIAIPASTAPRSAATFIETNGALSGEGYPLIGYNGMYMEEATFLDIP